LDLDMTRRLRITLLKALSVRRTKNWYSCAHESNMHGPAISV
jgi:hypothetical protein